MKQALIFILIFASIVIAIPFCAFGANQTESLEIHNPFKEQNSSEPPEQYDRTEQVESKVDITVPESKSSFKILDKSTNSVIEVDDLDFIYGTVASEMPISYNANALKAQAVAAYSFYCEERAKQDENPTPELKGAYFECDSKNWVVYVSKEQMKESWKDDFDANYKKLTDAVNSVFGETLTYNGEPVLAAFHAISGGTTEDSSIAWGGKLEYLRPAESPGDLLAPDFKTRVSFSSDEFKRILTGEYEDIQLSDSPDNWIDSPAKSPSGTVIKIKIGNKEFTGNRIRTLFELRSPNFDLKFIDNEFVFDVRGYGHGVGMSQYGANSMANQGADYKEILKWYYNGVEIV